MSFGKHVWHSEKEHIHIMPIVWALWLSSSESVGSLLEKKRKEEEIKISWLGAQRVVVFTMLYSQSLIRNPQIKRLCHLCLFIYLFIGYSFGGQTRQDLANQLAGWPDLTCSQAINSLYLFLTSCDNSWFCYRNINGFDKRVPPVSHWHMTYIPYLFCEIWKILNREYIWQKGLWISDYGL